MELIKGFRDKFSSRKGYFSILFISIFLLYAAMLPLAYAFSTSGLVDDVPSTGGISIDFIESMQVLDLDGNSNELFFVTQNEGPDSGVIVWKRVSQNLNKDIKNYGLNGSKYE